MLTRYQKNLLDFFCINYTDTLFKHGLNFSLFIDISDTSFQFLTVWKSEKEWENSYKKAGEHLDIKKQIKEMGATMTIVGGNTNGRFTSQTNFNLLDKID